MRALLIILGLYLLLFLCYLARRKPIQDYLLLVAIVSVPLQIDYTLIEMPWLVQCWASGVLLRLSDLLFILLFLYQAWTGNGPREHGFLIPRNMLLSFGAFLLACLFSLANSVALAVSGYLVVMLLKGFLIYCLLFYNSLKSEADARAAVHALTVCLFIQAGIGVLQSLFSLDLSWLQTGRAEQGVVELSHQMVRASGTSLGRPNSLASLILPLLMVNISLYVSHNGTIWRLLVILCSLLALIFTFSRGGWIGFSAALLTFGAISLKSGTLTLKRVRALSAPVLLLLILAFPLLSGRLTGDDQNSARSRVPLVHIALAMIDRHPVIGVGGNTFLLVIKEYLPRGSEEIYLDRVHNQYLLVFAECGALGLFGFLLLMRCIWREMKRCARNSDHTFARAVGAGALCGLVAMSLHMMVDVYVSEPILALLFLLFSLCAALNRGRLAAPPPESEPVACGAAPGGGTAEAAVCVGSAVGGGTAVGVGTAVGGEAAGATAALCAGREGTP